MAKLSVVIPCYGSENTIAGVVQELCAVLGMRPETDYEIVLVNDSSPDGVGKVIQALAAENPQVKGVELARNFGQHAAIMAGMHYITGDVVVCMDDDGQTPASEIYKLVDMLDEGYDAVFASYGQKKHSLLRNLGSRANDAMAKVLLNKPKDLQIMSYFAVRRFVVEEIIRYNNPYPYLAGLVLRTTNRVANVPVEHHARVDGASGYTMKKLISLWVNGFTAFSVKPLRLASGMGIVLAALGAVYFLYIIFNKLLNPLAPIGYSSIMAALLLIGGIVMLMLGLIGEYVGRMYISINKSPQYTVRQTFNIKEEE